MKISLRQETSSDYPAVAEAIKAAHKDVDYSNHREQFMVERLRNSDALIPQLSLVAEIDDEIVGHIMLTKIVIHTQTKPIAALALAPLSIVPEFQGQGIGSKLVLEGHRLAKELEYQYIVVLGHAKYYPRFGYEPLKNYGLELPFAVPEENCMILSLTENGMAGVKGKIEYPPEFLE